jgi:DNA-directed RNA polymerase specialized sigma24 family protein
MSQTQIPDGCSGRATAPVSIDLWENWSKEHRDALRRFALRVFQGDSARADDAVQHACLETMTHHNAPVTSAERLARRSYAYRIIANEPANDSRKKAPFVKYVSLAVEVYAEAPSPLDEILKQEEAELCRVCLVRYRQFLKSLPEIHAIAFHEYYTGEISLERAAPLLGVKDRATAKLRLETFMRQLRRFVT